MYHPITIWYSKLSLTENFFPGCIASYYLPFFVKYYFLKLTNFVEYKKKYSSLKDLSINIRINIK